MNMKMANDFMGNDEIEQKQKYWTQAKCMNQTSLRRSPFK